MANANVYLVLHCAALAPARSAVRSPRTSHPHSRRADISTSTATHQINNQHDTRQYIIIFPSSMQAMAAQAQAQLHTHT
jgi:hypothetical protein